MAEREETEGFRETFSESVPNILLKPINRLRGQEYYAFFERVNALGTLMIILTLALGAVYALANIGQVSTEFLITLIVGLAGASWLIAIALGGFLWFIAEMINYANVEGEKLTSDERSTWKRLGEHAFKLVGGLVMVFTIVYTFVRSSNEDWFLVIIIALGIAATLVFTIGMIGSGIAGFWSMYRESPDLPDEERD